MAYDGLFIKAQINEINNVILNEHISRITQKSHKEINFHIRKNNKNLIFSLSANPNFPYMLLSDEQVDNIQTPPAFCMLLRKYLQGGEIISIKQIGKKYLKKFDEELYLERIVKICIRNINDNGDYCLYNLYFEIMGKYSNIILTDEENTIIDILIKGNVENPRLAIKKEYSIKEIVNKNELMVETFDGFISTINEVTALASINNENIDLATGISTKYAGLSKQYVTSEIFKFINNKKRIKILPEEFNYKIISKYISCKDDYNEFFNMLITDTKDIILNKIKFTPTINYKGEKPSDFYIYKLDTYEGTTKEYNSLNECLSTFLLDKYNLINDTTEQKNLEQIIKTLYTKLAKKLDIYKKDLEKCKDLDIYKNYGELVSAFGYNLEDIKDGILTCKDYNNNDQVVHIPVDESLTVAQNVERYYDKYNKLKRTKDNVEKLIDELHEKYEHLNSIAYSLTLPNDKNDLYLLKEEILNYFPEASSFQNLKKQKSDIANRKSQNTNNKSKSSKMNYNIHHYKSSNGIDIYVGKNNLQNDYLTFKLADSNDTWFHVKNATGSHVIVKMPYDKLDDKTLEEAASIAAYFSEKKNDTKVTVDYTLRKELKKVKGKAPGFCIYHKNYSINVVPKITIEEV